MWSLPVVLLFSAVSLAAHDGHDEITVLIGTVIRVDSETIQLGTFDNVRMQRHTVSVGVDAMTKFLLGKKRVDKLDLEIGQRIQVTVQSEHTRDDSIRLRALEIRLNAQNVVAAGQHAPRTHRHAEAARLVNPVKPEATSIAAGQQMFATHCASCHGPIGAGDGVQAPKFNPKPSNLVDAQWKHGPSDGEIFTVIKDGVPKTSMASFSKKITDRQMWDVVNYVRSLGPKSEPSHVH